MYPKRKSKFRNAQNKHPSWNSFFLQFPYNFSQDIHEMFVVFIIVVKFKFSYHLKSNELSSSIYIHSKNQYILNIDMTHTR